jgi:hypothetical protein
MNTKRFLLASVSALLLLSSSSIYAAERVTFFIGSFYRSVDVSELEHTVETGEAVGLLADVLKAGKMDASEVVDILTKRHKFTLRNMSNLAHSPFGKAILRKFDKVIFPRHSRRYGEQALRSAIILSVAEDDELQILELLQNYPTNIGVDLIEAKKLSEKLSDL